MTPQPAEPSVKPADLRLRPNPRPAVRLSRKFLIGLSTVAGLGIGGALMFALQPQSTKPAKAAEPSYSTKTKPVAEQFNALPKDYASVPQLGPPLAGDLGKAVLSTQGQSLAPATPAAVPVPVPTVGTGARASPQAAAVSAGQSRAIQMLEAAKTSQLFAPGHSGNEATPADTPTQAAPAIPLLSAFTQGAPTAQADAKTVQSRQADFLNQPADRMTVSPDRLQAPASPYLLQAGSVIPAALITGLRSDLPGQVTAQVSENIYDTLTGRYLLVPQGSRLIGQYDNAIAFGQTRVLLAWTRLILPNGKSLVLEKLSAADAAGFAGLSDRTDYHWNGMLQAAAISTVLSVGAEAGSSDTDSDIVRALRTGASDSIGRTGQQIVERQLNIQPTLTIRPGFPVRVILSRDLVLEPYGN